jgi:hypothetical protein
MLFCELLTSLFQTRYDTMLLHTQLFHFGIVLRHSLQISLETLQIIVSFLIELIKFDIFLL